MAPKPSTLRGALPDLGGIFMEERITMNELQDLAERLVSIMRGKGGAAVTYTECDSNGKPASISGRPCAILHMRNVINRLKGEVEDVFDRVLRISASLTADNIAFELSDIPTFALRICDAHGQSGIMVITIYQESVVDYSRCLAEICKFVTKICANRNSENPNLALGYYDVFGGFREDDIESIYFESYETPEVLRRIRK